LAIADGLSPSLTVISYIDTGCILAHEEAEGEQPGWVAPSALLALPQTTSSSVRAPNHVLPLCLLNGNEALDVYAA